MGGESNPKGCRQRVAGCGQRAAGSDSIVDYPSLTRTQERNLSNEQLAVNAIKALAMDGVQAANSGHPGAPMGMADMATVLWTRFLVVDPADPTWPDRDRFIVSNGHASMLVYGLLHLSGFPLEMDDLKNFRQFGYPTPGHPEREPHLGIETTTGPLGQGFGTGVGMAIAEEHLRAVFGDDLVNHRTFGLVSDGDLMEGISSESASMAGHLGLGRLVYLYDDNEISIEGDTDLAFTEDVGGRFRAFGWHIEEVDGHDRNAVAEAIESALIVPDQPSLIVAHTHIAHGSPNKVDSESAHGSPLGDEEIRLTKELMNWPTDEPFTVLPGAYEAFAAVGARGAEARAAWEARRDQAFADSEIADRWDAYWNPAPVAIGDLGYAIGDSVATRKSSGKAINDLAGRVPNLLGGSADLAPSTNTLIDGSGSFSKADRLGRNFHFGIREHGMGAAVNGMAIHGGLRPYGATFLVFNDYMRPAVRLSALMGAPSIWVYTHDSVFLGEDGPTHQPIEQLASLRAMPNLWVVRPADAGETAEAWEMAVNRTDGPTCLILTRQGIPTLEREAGGLHRGGYVLRDGTDATIVATGSEVSVALAAAGVLEADGTSVRVVSMPCVEAFLAQDETYRTGVLSPGMPVASLEAAATLGWHRFTGKDGMTIGIDHFGASAPAGVLAEEFGFTPDAVAARVREWLS
ncbi:MAG: transketolase [Acidimicrobiia bacterium]|nr:transketolase [Acidimicrobiia bacterium]